MSVFAMVLAAFFAMNMGGSNLSPAFAAPYGAGAISRKKAAVLFGVFVLLGAFLAGGKVVKTISQGIVPGEFVDPSVAFIILLAAALSLFIANLLRVAVSTSSVTVFSLISVGLYFGQINTATLIRMFSFWLVLPFLAYLMTFILSRLILPLEQKPWLQNKQWMLRGFVMLVGCFVAFSIGSNNVPNAVGPLVSSGIVDEKTGFLLIAPFFGVGGFLFRKVLNTVGKEITGIGVLGAAINGTVIGTLLLLSSEFGMPEPMVMLDATSMIGIGSANRGHKYIITQKVVRKIFTLWIVSPLISMIVTYLLLIVIK